MSHGHRITVVHATAPTCWWSWGYEPVFNRLQLVYGDQINIVIFYAVVYEDIEQYKTGTEQKVQNGAGRALNLRFKAVRSPAKET